MRIGEMIHGHEEKKTIFGKGSEKSTTFFEQKESEWRSKGVSKR